MEQGLANYSPQVQFSPLSVFVNKVLLAHSHHLRIVCGCFPDATADLTH